MTNPSPTTPATTPIEPEHVHDWTPWGPSPLSETLGVERHRRVCRGCDLYQDEPVTGDQPAPKDAAMDRAVAVAAVEIDAQLEDDAFGPLRIAFAEFFAERAARRALAAAMPHIERATLERLAAMTNVDGAPYRATMWLDWVAEQFDVELHTDAISILYDPSVARGGEATE